jgi:hypothetical protein
MRFKLTEKEFIKLTSEKHYMKLVEFLFRQQSVTPEYLDFTKESCYMYCVSDTIINGIKYELITESTANLIGFEMRDFGINTITLTDKIEDEDLDKICVIKDGINGIKGRFQTSEELKNKNGDDLFFIENPFKK